MISDQTARANPSNRRIRPRSDLFELFEGDSDPYDDFEIAQVSDYSDSSSASEEKTREQDPRSRSTVPDEVGPRPDQFGWQEIDLKPNKKTLILL